MEIGLVWMSLGVITLSTASLLGIYLPSFVHIALIVLGALGIWASIDEIVSKLKRR